MKRAGSTLVLCGILVSAIGIGWCTENASGASVNDPSFCWAYAQGASNGQGWGTGGYNFATAPKGQYPNYTTCGMFADTGILESWYKITRDDPTDVWCGASMGDHTYQDNTGLSEQVMTNLWACLHNGGVNQLLTRADLPYTGNTTTGWSIPPQDANRILEIPNNPPAYSTDMLRGVTQLKAALLADGPMDIHIAHNIGSGTCSDYTDPQGDTALSTGNKNYYSPTDGGLVHYVTVIGWCDLPNHPDIGNGYFIVRDSGSDLASISTGAIEDIAYAA